MSDIKIIIYLLLFGIAHITTVIWIGRLQDTIEVLKKRISKLEAAS